MFVPDIQIIEVPVERVVGRADLGMLLRGANTMEMSQHLHGTLAYLKTQDSRLAEQAGRQESRGREAGQVS